MSNKRLKAIALLAVAYLITGKIGLLLVLDPGYASAIWPASGIALAGLLISGYSAWPGLWLGSFLLHFFHSLDICAGKGVLFVLALSSCIGAGAALQALLGSYLIKKTVEIPNDFRHFRHAFTFLTFGGPISCLVSATVGIGSLWGFGIIGSETLSFSWSTWWIGDTMGVLIFSAPILAWKYATALQRRRFPLLLGVPVLTCFVITFIAFYVQAQWEEGRLQLRFEKSVGELSILLENHLKANKRELQSLAFFYEGSKDLSPDEFKIFAQNILDRNPEIQALEWADFVPHEEREEFEKRIEIRERDSDGKMVPAEKREYYVPVTHIEPFVGNEATLGFDLASQQTRLEALLESAKSGEGIATGPVQLVQDSGASDPAFIIFTPTYASDEPIKITGYLLGVYRVDDLLFEAWRGWEQKGVAVELVDVTNQESPLRIYTNDAFLNLSEGRRYYESGKKTIIAGRLWKHRYLLTESYRAAHRSSQAWVTLVIGLLFTSLAGIFLLVRLGNSNLIHELMEKLKGDKERLDLFLEKLFASSSEGILICDQEGKVLLANVASATLLKSSVEKMIGTSFSSYFSMEGKEEGRHELHAEAVDGTKVPVEASLTKFEVEGKVQQLLIFTDVSGRRQQQRELLEINRELVERNRELDDFAYIASHDLKEPLRGISNYSQFLLEDYEKELDSITPSCSMTSS